MKTFKNLEGNNQGSAAALQSTQPQIKTHLDALKNFEKFDYYIWVRSPDF